LGIGYWEPSCRQAGWGLGIWIKTLLIKSVCQFWQTDFLFTPVPPTLAAVAKAFCKKLLHSRRKLYCFILAPSNQFQ